MAELFHLTKSALIIIEKMNASLPDDSYLEKFLSGLREKFASNNLNPEDIILKCELKTFCERNFRSEVNSEMQCFTFSLCKIVCTFYEEWMNTVRNFLTNLKIWHPSPSLFDLIQILLQFNKVDIELVWTKLLAQVVIPQNHENNSFFWKKSAQNLLTSFLRQFGSSSVEVDGFKERIVQVIQENLTNKRNVLLSNAIVNAIEEIYNEQHLENFKKIFVNCTDILPLKAQVCLQMRLENEENNNASVILNERFIKNCDPPKVWIDSAKLYLMSMHTINDVIIEEKCLNLAAEDHKLISSLSIVPCLTQRLWNLIFDEYLSTFLNQDGIDLPIRDFNSAQDNKLFTSCISNLNTLASRNVSNTIAKPHWIILVNLSMIPELSPVCRSSIIDLIRTLIELNKVQISMESLASQLWHLIRYQEWEVNMLQMGNSCWS